MEKQRYFYSFDYDKIYTLDDLRQDYDDDNDGGSFEDYVENCQTRNNGTLDEITNNRLQDYLQEYQFGGRWYKIFLRFRDNDEVYEESSLNGLENALVCDVQKYAESVECFDESGKYHAIDVDHILIFLP